MNGHKSPHQTLAGSELRSYVGDRRAGSSVVPRSEREGQGGGRHTNEAA